MNLVVGKDGFLSKRFKEHVIHNNFEKGTHNWAFCKSFEAKDEYVNDNVFWLSGTTDYKSSDSRMIADNTKDLFEYFDRNVNIGKFIFVSTASIQQVTDDEITSKSFSSHEYKICPQNDYALSKLMCEKFLQLKWRQGKIKHLAVVRPCAFIGRNANHGAVKDSVTKTLASKQNNSSTSLSFNSNNLFEQIEVYGVCPGSSKPLISVDDVCSMLYQELDKTDSVSLYTISHSDILSVKEIFDETQKIFGTSRDYNWIDNPWGEKNIFCKYENAEALKRGWKPKYESSLETLRATLEEYKRDCN